MRGISWRRGAVLALFAWLLPFGVMGQASVDKYTARREGPLIQRLLQQPLPPGHRETHRAVQVLVNSGNLQEGDLLDRFEKRRVLARLTGEPPEVAATIGAAIEREAAPPEKLDDAVWRALERVVIEYSPEAARASQPLPQGFNAIGPGVWVKIAPPYGELRALLVIRNGLTLPARGVTLYYGQTRKNLGSYLIRLNCAPDGGEAFNPGTPQQALCTASGERPVVEDAVKALAERAVAAPFLASTVKTSEATLIAGAIAPEDPSREVAGEARTELAGASCEDKGTCAGALIDLPFQGAELLSVKTRAERQAEGPSVIFGGLTLVVFTLAGIAAFRATPAEVKGGFVSFAAGVAIVVSALAAVAVWLMLRPRVGDLFFLYLAGVYYGAFILAPAVVIVVFSLLFGNVTRPRVFAATVGMLVPASIAAIVFMQA